MQDLARRALYFDFYASLLTEKQREVYDLYYQQDLSLGEISVQRSISRQAVFDLLKRTEAALLYYESKLCLVEKYRLGQEIMAELKQKLAKKSELVTLLEKLENSW